MNRPPLGYQQNMTYNQNFMPGGPPPIHQQQLPPTAGQSNIYAPPQHLNTAINGFSMQNGNTSPPTSMKPTPTVNKLHGSPFPPYQANGPSSIGQRPPMGSPVNMSGPHMGPPIGMSRPPDSQGPPSAPSSGPPSLSTGSPGARSATGLSRGSPIRPPSTGPQTGLQRGPPTGPTGPHTIPLGPSTVPFGPSTGPPGPPTGPYGPSTGPPGAPSDRGPPSNPPSGPSSLGAPAGDPSGRSSLSGPIGPPGASPAQQRGPTHPGPPRPGPPMVSQQMQPYASQPGPPQPGPPQPFHAQPMPPTSIPRKYPQQPSYGAEPPGSQPGPNMMMPPTSSVHGVHPSQPPMGMPNSMPLASQGMPDRGQPPGPGAPPMPGQGGPCPGQPMPGPMSGPMGGAAPQKRIDPNQMPNPIQVMKDDQESFNGETFATSTRGKVPPLVSTKCRIVDDGNCSPRHMRSTVYSIPCNQDMLKESGIPMAIISTPFAKIPEDEQQLRYVDHGPAGPVRCNRCKAYMNPFMQFIDGGRRFVCNICSHSSEVPQEYFCHLDHQGRRVDMYERPELCFGSYEYIATTDYCKDSKLPSPPAFIFMIDVSYQSIQQGMVKILANELLTLLDNLPCDVGMDDSLIKVGFVTYNNQLHFYNVKENLSQPQMMVVTDLDDSFVPLQDGFLVNYKESKGVIDTLLELLPEMFADTRETDVMLGPVISAAIDALKGAGIAGKLFIFHSSLPIADAPGKLKNREDRKLLGTDKEKQILIPQGNHYMNVAKACVKSSVSIDLFLFPNSYIDVATLGLMVTQTGGQIYRYSYFKESTHGKQFISDLRKNFKREIGFDAIMRLRCSTGLRPVEFFGSFIMENTTDVELASIDSDKAIAIEIKHDDKIPEDGVTFVQNALLYTSVSGQRRLRINNLAFSTCSQLADLYRCCELDATVNFLSKYALRQVLSSTPQQIKDNLVLKCVQVLACYRQHCATPSTSGQLILPECMKLLPLFINCLIKSDVLAGGSEMSSDDRAFLMQATLSMPTAVTSSYFYPRVLSLHSLDLEHEDDLIPEQMRCLGDNFKDHGVYLLENTISMFLWVGLQVDPKFLQDVFGANSIGQLDVEMTQLPELDTPISKRIRQIIEAIQYQNQRYLKLSVVRQKDKLEPWFKHYVVEDKGFQATHLSYVDFLCHVHKEIRNLLN